MPPIRSVEDSPPPVDEDFTITLTIAQWREVIAALGASQNGVAAIGAEIEDCLPAPQPQPAPEPLSGQKVRNVLADFRTGISMSELAAELQESPKAIMAYLKPLMLSGTVIQRGAGRGVTYAYVRGELGTTPAREDKRPPEKDPPAMLDSKATGMPVRIRTERADRKGRSTPGQRQKLIQRDRAYERMQAARKAAMEVQMAKAQKEPKWKRKKK